MRFRDDTRGVTVQVGAVLLFATVIIALAVFQATVVPAENADVEYRHSQQAQGQLVDVRNALVATAETGNARPATVSLGTQYPNRLFLVNPPPPAGTLETDDYDGDSNITLSNVRAAENNETADYLNFTASDPWTAETKALTYVPGYHEYRDAPEVRYEASLLSNYYPDENTSVPVADQLLVNENTSTISLVALNGSLSTSRSSSVALDPVSLSSSQRVQVEPETDNESVKISLPTVLDADTLNESFADTESVEVRLTSENRVHILVDWDDSFTLRTAKVGVGSETNRTSAHYLTAVEPRPDDGPVTLDSTSDSVTVEVRDRFNNPKPGETVDVASGTGAFDAEEQVTDENGQATFEVNDSASSTTATLRILGGGTAERRVNVSIDTTSGGDGGGGGIGGAGNDTYNVTWQDPEELDFDEDNETWVLNTTNGTSVDLTSLVQANEEAVIGTTVDHAHNASTFDDPSGLSLSPDTGVTDIVGQHTTTLSVPRENGTIEVYAASGDDVDTISVHVDNPPGAGTTDPGQAFRDFDNDGVYDEGTDELIPDSEIQDGTHDAGSERLVIPESVGDISASSIDFAGNGVTLRTNVEATNGEAQIDGGNRDIVATGVGISSTSGTSLSATNDVTVTGSTVEATNGEVSMESSDGGVNADTAQITATSAIDVTAESDVSLAGATVEASNGGVTVESSEGTLNAENADISSNNNEISLTSSGDLTLTGASVDAVNSGMTVEAIDGDVVADNATLSTQNGNLEIISDGDVNVEQTSLTASNANINVDLGGGNHTLDVDGAMIEDNNDTLNYSPNGVDIEGTPASGGTQ